MADGPKRVLVVDDDPIMSRVYWMKLNSEGYEVECAHDGQSAIESLYFKQFDLVLLDLVLPGLSGLEVLRNIRSRRETHHLPVVVLSNSYSGAQVEAAWEAGANRCMTKAGCTPKHLVELVRTTLAEASRARAEREPEPQPPAPPEPPPKPTLSTLAGEADVAHLVELQQVFVEGAAQIVAALESRLRAVIAGGGKEADLAKLLHTVHALVGKAAFIGFHQVAEMSSALEALLKELIDHPQQVTSSTLKTVSQATEILIDLVEQCAPSEPERIPPFLILAVDDSSTSRRLVGAALEKVNLRAVLLADPLTALSLCGENNFDLIFLDVDMPGMNGFDLCAQIRLLPNHAKTPVVFVTALSDFESRPRSTDVGGNDLIAKPFLWIELAVKALVYGLGRRDKESD
ncbi:MAG: response regulator [Candidatus Omnitrophica bacterium]|nr:response regulator [Candidatus Omnitrophota bacterium]